MFREIRRKDRAISESDARQILQEGSFGTLATVDANNWPYAIPVHYVLENETIYFHCAKQGQKIDNLRLNPNVCVSVVAESTVLPEQFATKYASACAFGSAEVVDRDERTRALVLLIRKYCKGFETQGVSKVNAEIDHPEVVAIRIKRITGKARSFKPEV